jgi:hypothetical protein
MSNFFTSDHKDYCADPFLIVDVFFHLVEGDGELSSYGPQGFESPKCVMSRDGENLSILVEGSERLIVSKEEILLLWARFKERTVREDRSLDFSQFFKDIKRWGEIDSGAIKEVVALLMVAEGTLREIDDKRREDGMARITPLLPIRFPIDYEEERPAYAVDFRLEAGKLVFEKDGRMVVISEAEVRAVWYVFVGLDNLPGANRKLRTALGLYHGKDEERRFFAYELSCLMYEAEFRAASRGSKK